MNPVLWWVRQVLFIAAGAFFLFFGTLLMVAAYQLKDALHFIMTFFSASLIILISAALLFGFLWHTLAAWRNNGKETRTNRRKAEKVDDTKAAQP